MCVTQAGQAALDACHAIRTPGPVLPDVVAKKNVLGEERKGKERDRRKGKGERRKRKGERRKEKREKEKE